MEFKTTAKKKKKHTLSDFRMKWHLERKEIKEARKRRSETKRVNCDEKKSRQARDILGRLV
jgi:hypothetical protein